MRERVRPCIQSSKLGASILRTGQQDALDTPQGGIEPDAANYRGAIDPRQHSIHDNRMWVPVGCQTEPLFPARGCRDAISGSLKRVTEHLTECHAVVDDEYAWTAAVAIRSVTPGELACSGHNVPVLIRFADVLVSPSLESADAVLDFRLGRQHQNCDSRCCGSRPQLLQELRAITVRQDDVKHHDAE